MHWDGNQSASICISPIPIKIHHRINPTRTIFNSPTLQSEFLLYSWISRRRWNRRRIARPETLSTRSPKKAKPTLWFGCRVSTVHLWISNRGGGAASGRRRSRLGRAVSSRSAVRSDTLLPRLTCSLDSASSCSATSGILLVFVWICSLTFR